MRISPVCLVLGTAPVLLIALSAPAPSPSALESSLSSRGNERVLQPTPEPPALPAAERMRLAFPGFEPGVPEVTSLFPGRMVDQDFVDWPPMRFLGESTYIAGKTFTVQDVLLVPGETYPIVYEPATGNMRPAPGGLQTNLFDFSKNTRVFIPPNTTLVMVQVDVEPEAVEQPPGIAGCRTPGERTYDDLIRISYPGNGETRVLLTSSDEALGVFASPTHYCLTSGWHYFHVDGMEVVPGSLWFEVIDGEVERAVALWTLAPPQPE